MVAAILPSSNAMGFQASALGNHELDLGTAAFASVIGSETDDGRTYIGALFPYLSANLDFTADENLAHLVVPDGQEAMLVGGSLARSAVVTVGGERIGIVGATTPTLASITGAGAIAVAPDDIFDVDALAAIIQGTVDELVDQGINKVILLSHMQRISVEQALATRLETLISSSLAVPTRSWPTKLTGCGTATRPTTLTLSFTVLLTTRPCCWSTPMATTNTWAGW